MKYSNIHLISCVDITKTTWNKIKNNNVIKLRSWLDPEFHIQPFHECQQKLKPCSCCQFEYRRHKNILHNCLPYYVVLRSPDKKQQIYQAIKYAVCCLCHCSDLSRLAMTVYITIHTFVYAKKACEKAFFS